MTKFYATINSVSDRIPAIKALRTVYNLSLAEAVKFIPSNAEGNYPLKISFQEEFWG